MFRRLYKIAKSVLSRRADESADKNTPRRKFRFESLESKDLLTGMIDIDVSGVVTIQGDNGNDNATAFDDGSRVVVSLDGFGSRSYQRSAVSRIDFFGGSGNDRFRSNSVVQVRAFGEGGDDNLTGGSSNDILDGGDGNDRLGGGDGNDRITGGSGNDRIFGGEGRDTILGQDGNDRLIGQGGNDTINGGNGDDLIIGDGGNDILNGEAGNDNISGSTGNDTIRGQGGNDILLGGLGNDNIYGGVGNDDISGGGGDDRIDAGGNDDFVRGDDGSDNILLAEGNDTAYGGNGRDRILGASGSDSIWGGAGDDLIEGQGGDDVIRGGAGNDRLTGSVGNDMIFGNGGNDLIKGDEGQDSLYGGSGLDRIYGGRGMDGLFGGIDGSNDLLFGGAGEDRYLGRDGDSYRDRFAHQEALVQFSDEELRWTNNEVEVIDRIFRKMHLRTRNTELLKDSLTNQPMQFVKAASLSGGLPADNQLVEKRTRVFNEDTQRFEEKRTVYRRIRLANWNESVAVANDRAVGNATQMIAKNWDSTHELKAFDDEFNRHWEDFKRISNWTDKNPHDEFNYRLSQDRLWWYTVDSVFVTSLGDLNPSEDWATVWDHYYNVNRTHANSEINAKLQNVDAWFNTMRET